MNNLKNQIPKYVFYILVLLWGIACFTFFQGWYHYHFFYQEQNQLFPFSWDYLSTYFDKPAWLACMVGDFLTQFYYYLYAGPAILTLVILMTGMFCYRAILLTDIKNPSVAYLTAIGIMTVEAIFSFHYDYRLSSILAFAGGAATFCISTKVLTFCRKKINLIENLHEWHTMIAGLGIPHWLSILFIAISTPLCFWLFGYGVWIYGVLVLLGCLFNIKQEGNYVRTVTIVAVMFLIMLSKRSYFLDFSDLYSYPGIGKFIKPQFNLERSFSVDDEYYFGNYNKVVRIVEEDETPNPYMKFYYNLVMAQRGCLPDKLLAFQDNNLGTFEQLGPDTPALTIKSVNELYWALGDMTFTERAAMLSNVCSPDKRNIRMMKRLAEINLVSNNLSAAKKYLRILQHTFVWKNWANKILASLETNNKHQQSTEVSSLLLAYQEKAKFTNLQDTLRTNQNAHVIMEELLQSNPDNEVALQYLLCSDLLLKDMDSFKHDYDTYYLKQKTQKNEKLYQEALMIYLAGTNASPAEWLKYIKRNDIMQRFQQYNQQRGSAIFADTYWYYFDKAVTPQPTK